MTRQHEALAKIYGLHGEKSNSRKRNHEALSIGNQNLSSENSFSYTHTQENSLNRENRVSINNIKANEFEIDKEGHYSINPQIRATTKPNSGAGFRRSNLFS